MRVDPNYILNLSASVSQSTTAEATLTGQLSSGLRVSQVGDDPVAAAQALEISTALSRSDTFVQTASQKTSVLQVTDSTLGEVVSQLTSAVTLATRGSDGTLSASDVAALAQQLRGVQAQVLSLANASYGGQYLFAGSKGSVQPYTLDNTGTAVYAGDTVQQSVQTPSGQSLVISLAGSSVFEAAGGSVFGALTNIINDLSTYPVSSTTASDSTQLTAALGQVSQQRSILDISLSRLQATSTYTQTQEASLKTQQTALVASDTVGVATQLKSVETQHEALLSLIAALGKGSLFDYLK